MVAHFSSLSSSSSPSVFFGCVVSASVVESEDVQRVLGFLRFFFLFFFYFFFVLCY